VLAGVMYALTGVVDRQGPLYPRFFSSPSDYLVQYTFLMALAGTLVALVGLHILQRGSYGWTGTAGFAVALAGHLLFLWVVVEQIFQGTSVGPGTQQLGSYAVPIGLMLLALATLLAGVLPRWCVVALLAGGVLAYLSKFMIWSPLLGVVLGAVWASVGYALLSGRYAPARRPTRVS
jgi:hypothetical protein